MTHLDVIDSKQNTHFDTDVTIQDGQIDIQRDRRNHFIEILNQYTHDPFQLLLHRLLVSETQTDRQTIHMYNRYTYTNILI